MKQQGCSNRSSLRESSRSVGIQAVEPQSKRRQSDTSPHTAFRTSVSAIMTQVCITSKTCVCIRVCASICTRVRTGTHRIKTRQLDPLELKSRAALKHLHGCWEPNLSPHKGSTLSQQPSPASSPSQELSPDLLLQQGISSL